MLRFVLMVMVLGATAVSAQTLQMPRTPILTIESDRLFSESAFGLRVAEEIEAEQSVLMAENRKIEAELAAEEKRLTDLRKEMSPGDFRAIADAFDERVQEIRRTRDAKGRAIGEMRERQQSLFIQAAQPILIELMRNAGAAMILERRTVLISIDAVDITNLAIEKLNAAIGDGTDLSNE